ncbi:DASH family cryptochrome [Halomicrobium sp. IBSBa]|uniref:DASH family cryptochrome n=1 Tax=Halomicrobium sp. IBSBa TaxID=2778916 RepID=UPI001ABF05F3|nr:DASH family cryptochrome [Halomicrobium sp. IBSBa]MBO4248239.1 DASH family cryptochrome [Halomicrobium sp. IBSBa]
MSTVLVWFRRDLRCHDNATLRRAVAEADTVVPLYCLPDRLTGEGMFGLDKVGPHRAQFLIESLADLRESLRDRDGELYVRSGDPGTVVPEAAAEFDADAVYWQALPGPEERAEAGSVRAGLADAGIGFETFWTHTLYHREDLPRPPDEIEDTFTPWKDRTEAKATVRPPKPAPEWVHAPDGGRRATSGADDLPTLAEFGFGEDEAAVDDRGVLDWTGGETAGLDRVATYVWERDCLREYRETRNGLVGADYSSKFSPWLSFGCLSPRRLHREVEQYETDRVANDSTYWLVFELTWRDFFQYQLAKYGAKWFQPGGIRERDDIRWRRDREQFERWARGETGIPFVDANMRELNATGYMSNRGRQNVASFLANNLRIDWRLGAAYFESRLVDYDVASNWCNWAYQSQVGNDSRDNYFEIVGQATHYDPEGAYVTRWCPALSALPPEYVHEPWTMSEREQAHHGVELGIDYPAPMIDLEASYEKLR